MQLILCKGNANREQNEMNVFISYAEMQLILCKGNAKIYNLKDLSVVCSCFIHISYTFAMKKQLLKIR